mmetsp:Transcript_3823/g.10037  ORF Transcript_3823/g.10037 Transcript_3823/m.10037 type:complete len:239 (-) Transcript_3823:503-1219(-)
MRSLDIGRTCVIIAVHESFHDFNSRFANAGNQRRECEGISSKIFVARTRFDPIASQCGGMRYFGLFASPAPGAAVSVGMLSFSSALAVAAASSSFGSGSRNSSPRVDASSSSPETSSSIGAIPIERSASVTPQSGSPRATSSGSRRAAGGRAARISPGRSTYSMTAIGALSPARRLASFMTRVYPPSRNRYRGPSTSKSFVTFQSPRTTREARRRWWRSSPAVLAATSPDADDVFEIG